MSALPCLQPRDATGHKGDYGNLLLIGGSRTMPGAIALSAMAALQSGAGRVTVATADCIHTVVAGFHPCYMTVALPSAKEGTITVDATSLAEHVGVLERYDVIAVGPGLGQSESLQRLITALYERFQGPMVVDADALNLLAADETGLPSAAAARVLTPHPGEFRRLTQNAAGGEPSPGRESEEALAVKFAGNHSVVLALKGHATLVTDGRQQWHNTTGNPGMATAGSGDVLTGIIAALIGQGMQPGDATRLGVYVHGQAGDSAAANGCELSLTAQDILDCLSAAWHHVTLQQDA